ncbi:hypothetical protein GTP46_02390 [Duganella sp. FT135W]|uniref:SbsA Ig-like domain-containing protein n=1 Tax=Duganella flavida TaxID=2692175 RepID=A0A6L8K1Z6_9BURK|nr:Ig-like domain-containing protein [Duganella flavida]MYM21493.1 hypothetical protein [Duganella flavida]
MTSPALLSVSSSDNSTITLHFDSAVSAGTGAIVVSDGFSQAFVGETGLSSRIVGATDKRVLASGDTALAYSGTDIVVHLATPLKSGLNYSVTMNSGTVINTAHEPNARIGSTTLFKFTSSGASGAPATPSAVIGSDIHFTDTGVSSTDYITVSATQTMSGTYTGTLGESDFIQVSLDNGASWFKATPGEGHTWSYRGEINLSNLTHGAGDALNGTLLARVSNLAGGTSGSASHSYVYNSHPIAIEVSGAMSFSADTGTSSTDLITNTTAQTISGTYGGTLLDGQILQVSVDGGANWINAVASAGSWHTSGSINLASGANTLQARVTDAAGNTSELASADYQLLTSTVSLADHALTLPSSTDSGVSSSDGITTAASKVTLNVAGLTGFHAGDTIQILDTSHSSAVVGSYVILASDLYYGDDYFSIDEYNPTARTTVDINLGALTDGAHTLAARILDMAGNTAAASGATTVTIDSTAPTVSAIAPVEGATSVSTGLDKLVFTFDENIAIADGTVVTIVDDANPSNFQQVTLASSAASGTQLTINLGSALTSGTHYTVKGAVVTDLAGNVGITGDTPMLHFVTAGTYSGSSTPLLTMSYVDTAPASNTDTSSAQYKDGLTNNHTISVTGVAASSHWYYRTSSTDTWHLGGTANGSFTLVDGTYAMDQVQVKQTVDGIDSGITSISKPLVVDTVASTASVVGTPNAFSSGASSIGGAVAGSVDFSNEFVEVTFNHGVSWVKASTTFVGEGVSTWALSGISGSLGDNYGLRLSDQYGNISTFIKLGANNPAYYLSNSGVTYSHASDNNTIVFGGTGVDTITVGSSSVVVGGDGGTITTGSNSAITAGANVLVTTGDNSTVVTGGGSVNVVKAGANAHITTTTAQDFITLSSLTGAVLSLGTGIDSLKLSNASSFTLSSALGSSTGVDVIDFGASGTNLLNITTAASVHHLTDADHLVIDNSGGGTSTSVSLESLVWGHTGSTSGYEIYTDLSTSTIAILIATSIHVTLSTGTA